MLLEPTALAAMPAALGEALLFPDLDQDAYLEDRERRDVHDGARPLSRVDRRSPKDAAFPPVRNLDSDAVRGELLGKRNLNSYTGVTTGADRWQFCNRPGGCFSGRSPRT